MLYQNIKKNIFKIIWVMGSSKYGINLVDKMKINLCYLIFKNY